MTWAANRCATSQRCRQPVAFTVDLNSWRSLVCEKHLGVLASRLLALNPGDGDSLTVKRIEAGR